MDGLVSVGTLALLFGALAAVDGRVASQLGRGARAGDIAVNVLVQARQIAMDHVPLTAFTIVAVMLVLFMVRN